MLNVAKFGRLVPDVEEQVRKGAFIHAGSRPFLGDRSPAGRSLREVHLSLGLRVRLASATQSAGEPRSEISLGPT